MASIKVVRGELEAYYESHGEGRIEFAFRFEGNSAPFFLKDGQQLTVYNSDGSTLWSGKIHFVRRGLLDRHHLTAKIWSETKQRGVSYADWMDRFWRQPALKAKLEYEE